MMSPAAIAGYRRISLGMGVLFVLVGMLFVVFPDAAPGLFNSFSPQLGLPPAPPAGRPLYLALAVAYMYLVSWLAFLIYAHPENFLLPRLLSQAKLASALFSLGLFFLGAPYLVLLANAVVDGGIGLGYWLAYRRLTAVAK
jgi:hypothetical protein